MQEGKPSRTAGFVAMLRGVHQLIDRPLVFNDPLALRIIGRKLEANVRNHKDHFDQIDLRRLRAQVVARVRHTEDLLAQAVRSGIHQYVLLGAGLDSFAHRNPYSDLKVFEIDHPATQGWKRGLIAEAGLPHPAGLTFVPVDFERQNLEAELSKACFSFDRPAVIAWLGVTMYLTRAAFLGTLTQLSRKLVGSSLLVFDYVLSDQGLTAPQSAEKSSIAERAAGQGEPWLNFMTLTTIKADLQALGVREHEDLGADELNARYFSNRADDLAMAPFMRLVLARF